MSETNAGSLPNNKLLLEYVLAKEKIKHELQAKSLTILISTLEGEENRALFTSKIERALNINSIHERMEKLIALFPDNRITSPDTPDMEKDWLIKQIRNFAITGVLESMPIYQLPTPTQARDKLKEIIDIGEMFLKKIEEFHPHGWPMMAWRNSVTDKPSVPKEDMNEWNYFLSPSHPLRMFLEKNKKNCGIIASRVKQKSEYKHTKESIWQKAWSYYEILTGEPPTQRTHNYYKNPKPAPKDLYAGKFYDMIEILLPGVFTKKDLNALYARRGELIKK